MKTGTYTRLIITRFEMKHEELSALLGITPTEAENEGEEYTTKNKFPEKRRKYIAKESSWELRTDLAFEVEEEYTQTFEKHLNNVFEKLRPVKDKFLEATKNCQAWIYMVIDYYDFTPYLDIKKEMSKQLAEFNLDLYFKFYFIEDPEIEK